MYLSKLPTFIYLIGFLSLSLCLKANSVLPTLISESRVEILSHDDGTASGEMKLYMYLDIQGPDEDRGLTEVYQGTPDLINHSNRIFASQDFSDLAIYNIPFLEHGKYYVSYNNGLDRIVWQVDILLEGCTDPNASNYNPEAQLDNGSCEYTTEQCPDIIYVSTFPTLCGNSDGRIEVNAQGTSLLYRINPIRPWQSSNVFTNLPEGAHNVDVRNTSLNCNDSKTVYIDCQDHTCPEILSLIIVQQPTACNKFDGIVEIQATGSSNEYSIDGGNTWSASPRFFYLSAGTINAQARNIYSQCSDVASIILSCQPSCSDGIKNGNETNVDCGGSCPSCCPENITVTELSKPYCSGGNDGSFMINANGSDLEYSITNGRIYQSSNVFSGRRANRPLRYSIAVRSKKSGCVRKIIYTFECVNETPEIISIDINQGDCDEGNTGSINIILSESSSTNQTGFGTNGNNASGRYSFSIDNGSTYHGRSVFRNLAPGIYHVIVRNNETQKVTTQTVDLSCNSCYDGILNGDETDVDCGGSSCKSCDCPTIEEIKASIPSTNGGFGGGISGSQEGFLCDRPEYFDCPNCITYRSCHDEIDNDGDELCDCEDEDCAVWYDEVCEKPVEQCSDGLDNDEDGLVDCADPNCDLTFNCQISPSSDRSTGSIIDFQQISRDIHLKESEFYSSFVRSEGIIKWDLAMRFGPNGSDFPLGVPVGMPSRKSLNGLLVVDNRETLLYRYYTKNEIINFAHGSRNTDVNLKDQVRIAAIFLQIQLNLRMNIDKEIYDFVTAAAELNLSSDLTGGSLNGPEDCTAYKKTVELPPCVRVEAQGCPFNPTFEITEIRKTGITLCWTAVNCETEDRGLFGSSGDSGFDINFGGGSSGGSSASKEFVDRINKCGSAGHDDPPIDGGEGSDDESFCTAIHKILYECSSYSLGSPNNAHILEILSSIPDQIRIDGDDEGMLTEVAAFICETDLGESNALKLVKEYINYSVVVGLSEAVSFEKFQIALRYISEVDNSLSVVDLLQDFNIDDCLECESENCTSAMECIHNLITYSTLNALSEIVQQAQFELSMTGVEVVRWNHYGMAGLLQFVDGRWIYERESATPGIYNYWQFDGTSWIEYSPASFPEDMHFIDALLDAFTEVGHSSLDAVGLIPGLGEAADAINAVWYLAEGDITNASLSGLAIVPFFGAAPTFAKLAKNTLRFADEAGEVLVSNSGLIWTIKNYSSGQANAFAHILLHTQNTTKKAIHGVFADKDNIIGLVDEGFEQIKLLKANGSNARILGSQIQSDGKIKYLIEMGDNIGFEGGRLGSLEELTTLRVVLDANGTDIFTAFPSKTL